MRTGTYTIVSANSGTNADGYLSVGYPNDLSTYIGFDLGLGDYGGYPVPFCIDSTTGYVYDYIPNLSGYPGNAPNNTYQASLDNSTDNLYGTSSFPFVSADEAKISLHPLVCSLDVDCRVHCTATAGGITYGPLSLYNFNAVLNAYEYTNFEMALP